MLSWLKRWFMRAELRCCVWEGGIWQAWAREDQRTEPLWDLCWWPGLPSVSGPCAPMPHGTVFSGQLLKKIVDFWRLNTGGIGFHAFQWLNNYISIFLFKMIQDSLAESAIVWWRALEMELKGVGNLIYIFFVIDILTTVFPKQIWYTLL